MVIKYIDMEKRGRASSNYGKGDSGQTYLSPEAQEILKDAMKLFHKKNGIEPKKTHMINIALKKYLETER